MRLRSYQVVLSRRTAKSVISLLMIAVLLLWLVVYPITTAKALGLITVAGTVAMTLAVLASVVMITMGASGMDGAVRNQAAATGTEPLTYMGQLLNRFAASAGGILPATFASKLQAGMSYLSDGTLIFNSEATAAIADFQRWAWDSSGGDLVSYALPASAPDSWNVGEFTVYLSANTRIAQRGSNSYYLGTRVAGYPSASSSTIDYFVGTSEAPSVCYVVCTKHSNSSVDYYVWLAGNDLLPSVAVSLYNSGANAGSVEQVVTAPSNALHTWIYLRNMPNAQNALAVSSSIPTFDPSETVPSDQVIGDVDTFVGPMQQGQGTQLPLADKVTVSADAAARLHFDNYLRALAAAYAGTGTASVPVTDVGTGDEDTLPLSVPLDTPIGVTGVTDTAIDQSGSIAGSDSVAGDFAGTDDFTMDLTQFFPFCVPFDLYAILSKFDAAAEAPVIDWVFDFGDLGQYPLQLDFSAFDTVAAILRDLETVSFAVGLILLTKRLIQGGD